MGSDGDLHSEDIHRIEDIARKYIITDYQDDFLSEMNLPNTEEQIRKMYIEGETHLRTLFNSLLAFDNKNIYGNFGMFLLESYLMNPQSAERYAFEGIKNNRGHKDLYELRMTLAEHYEFYGRHREANEQYISNINETLASMKNCIDDFFVHTGNKLVFTRADMGIKLIEDENKTPLGTYIKASMLHPAAIDSQDENQRKDFINAKKLHEQGNYESANKLLSDLNYLFSFHAENLQVGIECLSKKMQKTFRKKAYSQLNKFQS